MPENNSQHEIHPNLQTPPANPEEQTPQTYYNGKYKTIADWENATRQSEQEASRLARENVEKDQRLQAMEAFLRQANPVNGTPARDPLDELSDIGIPKDILQRAVQAEARSEATKMLRPLLEGAQARQAMTQKFKDYESHEQEIMGYVASDPQRQASYNRMFQEQPLQAMEWALGMYRLENPGSVTAAPSSAGAEIPSSQGANPRGDEAAQNEYQEKLKKAYDWYNQTGDRGPVTKLAFYRYVPEHLRSKG